MSDGKVFLDFFAGELKSGNGRRKVEAVRRVGILAGALGPEQTRAKILPLLSGLISQGTSEDELLHALAEEYVCLTKYIDGEANFPLLLKPLGILAGQEETIVREAAVVSIGRVLAEASEKSRSKFGEEILFDVFKALSQGERFPMKTSACFLAPVIYSWISETQRGELRQIYNKLCADDTPMVRRAAASKLKDLFVCMDAKDLQRDMLPTLKTLAQDDTQDAIRVSCLHAACQAAKQLKSTGDHKTHLMPIFKAADEDRSWKIRLALANKFAEICSCFTPDEVSHSLLPSFILLLRDFEQDVRSAATTAIGTCIEQKRLTPENIKQDILPQLANLAVDANPNVRAALANVIGQIAEVLGQNATQKSLLNIVLELMRDEFRDVRLNVVCHAGEISKVCGLDNIEHPLLSTIKELMTDTQWRIRLSIVDLLPNLANQFGADIFHQKLETLLVKALDDSVYAVRECAVKNIGKVAKVFQAAWAIQHLIPKLADHYKKTPNYVHRMAGLHALPEVARCMETAQVEEHILPQLRKAFEDSVANVRLAAARVCKTLLTDCRLSSNAISLYIEPPLQTLAGEDDVDVKFYARQALTSCTTKTTK